MNAKLHHFIEDSVKRHESAKTLRFLNAQENSSIEDGEVIKSAKQFADYLLKIGVQEKDRIVLLSENCLEWIICYLGILYAGGISAPLNSELLADDTIKRIHRIDPILIICSKKQLDKLSHFSDSVPIIQIENLTSLMASTPAILITKTRNNSYEYDSIAAIVQSAGTEGKPKCVLLSHQSIIDVVSFYQDQFSQKWSSILLVLPLFAICPWTITLASFCKGIPVLFLERREQLSQILQQENVSCIPLVPLFIELMHQKIVSTFTNSSVAFHWFRFLTILSQMLRRFLHINIGKYLFASVRRFLGSHLELILMDGAPLNPKICKDFFCWGVTIREGYGLTETAGIVSCTNGSFANIGTAGKPVEDFKIKISHPQEEGMGEILIRGSRMMLGYFRDPEATSLTLKDGWFHTGDVGKFDPNGNLIVMGRLKDVLAYKDKRKALPEDIEECYQGLEGIAQLAIVGIADSQEGRDKLHMVIVLDPNYVKSCHHDISEARKLVEKAINKRAQQLPDYLRVDQIHIFDALPKNTLGKIKREEVREIIKEIQTNKLSSYY